MINVFKNANVDNHERCHEDVCKAIVILVSTMGEYKFCFDYKFSKSICTWCDDGRFTIFFALLLVTLIFLSFA